MSEDDLRSPISEENELPQSIAEEKALPPPVSDETELPPPISEEAIPDPFAGAFADAKMTTKAPKNSVRPPVAKEKGKEKAEEKDEEDADLSERERKPWYKNKTVVLCIVAAVLLVLVVVWFASVRRKDQISAAAQVKTLSYNQAEESVIYLTEVFEQNEGIIYFDGYNDAGTHITNTYYDDPISRMMDVSLVEFFAEPRPDTIEYVAHRYLGYLNVPDEKTYGRDANVGCVVEIHVTDSAGEEPVERVLYRLTWFSDLDFDGMIDSFSKVDDVETLLGNWNTHGYASLEELLRTVCVDGRDVQAVGFEDDPQKGYYPVLETANLSKLHLNDASALSQVKLENRIPEELPEGWKLVRVEQDQLLLVTFYGDIMTIYVPDAYLEQDQDNMILCFFRITLAGPDGQTFEYYQFVTCSHVCMGQYIDADLTSVNESFVLQITDDDESTLIYGVEDKERVYELLYSVEGVFIQEIREDMANFAGPVIEKPEGMTVLPT